MSLAEVPRTFATLVHFWWRHVVFHRPAPAPAAAAPVILPFPRPAVSGGRKAA